MSNHPGRSNIAPACYISNTGLQSLCREILQNDRRTLDHHNNEVRRLLQMTAV